MTFLFLFFSCVAPEVLNYDPVSVAADMWLVTGIIIIFNPSIVNILCVHVCTCMLLCDLIHKPLTNETKLDA